MSSNSTEFPSSLWEYDLIPATIVNLVGAALCAGAGIGGGAVYLSVYMLLMNLSIYLAVPLSKITILGTAIGSFYVNWNQRHPHANRPLIDYDISLLMEPMTLLGTVIGVLFNVAFPELIIVILLILLLLFTVYKTATKGWETFKKETKTAATPAPTLYGTIPTDQPSSKLTSTLSSEFGSNLGDTAFNAVSDAEVMDSVSQLDREEELDQIYAYEARIPWLKVLALTFVWLIMLLIVFLAGTDGNSIVGIKCGTWEFWVVLCLVVPWICGSTSIFAWKIRRAWMRKTELGYKFVQGDISWDTKHVIILPIISVVAGIASGFLGVGGGLVAGPIMLEFGMLPQAATTSAFQILYTSSSTSIQFIFLGRLEWKFALWFFAVGLVGAFIGQNTLSYILKKYKKQYIIAFLIAFAVALSAIALITVNAINIAKDKNRLDFHLHSLCTAGNSTNSTS